MIMKFQLKIVLCALLLTSCATSERAVSSDVPPYPAGSCQPLNEKPCADVDAGDVALTIFDAVLNWVVIPGL